MIVKKMCAYPHNPSLRRIVGSGFTLQVRSGSFYTLKGIMRAFHFNPLRLVIHKYFLFWVEIFWSFHHSIGYVNGYCMPALQALRGCNYYSMG